MQSLSFLNQVNCRRNPPIHRVKLCYNENVEVRLDALCERGVKTMRGTTKEISGAKKGAAKRVPAGVPVKTKGAIKTGLASSGHAVTALESTGIGSRKAKSRKIGSSK